MAKMKDLDLLTLLDGMEVDAVSNQTAFITKNEESLRRYKGDPYGNETAGRSSVVSGDVRDTVQSDMPSLVRTFLGSGPVMKFTALNPNNEAEVKEAEEKTAYVDWLIRSQDDSYKVQHGFLQDCEIQSMGVLKYMFEETEKTEEHSFKGVDEGELDEIFQSLSQGSGTRTVEVVQAEEDVNANQFDITFKVKVKRQEIRVVGVPTESFLISKDSSNLDESELVGDTESVTRGSLLAKGFSREIISTLPSVGSDSNNKSSMHQIRFEDEGSSDSDAFSQWSNELVEMSDLYVQIDYDGDGIAERRHIQKSGNVILVNDAFDHVPYAMSSALLVSHKAIGEGRGEQVEHIAAIKTALKRGVLDNGYMVNNPKMGVNDNVNLDDALSEKIGGVIRFKGEANPGQNAFPFQVPSIAQESLLIIQHIDQDKANAVGTALASQGMNSDQLGKETATRFMGVEKASMAKIELVTRNIAETGYRKLYSGVAWMVSRFQDTDREFSVLGKALTSNPGKWRFDHQLNSEVGLGAGDNDKMVENMTGILGVQQQMKASRSPLVDDVKIYNTLSKLTKGLEIRDVSQFFNNPEEPVETLKSENELLNEMVVQLQEQVKSLQNPLAEAEAIKREGDIVIAQGKLQLEVAKLEEDKRQFNIESTQKGIQDERGAALKLTDMELKSGKNVPGSVV